MLYEVITDYGIKPMNCPGHIMIYNNDVRSYRDLPWRLFEFGTVYRHELSGVVHGLMRARGFTQDDAHIFCRPDQLEDEILRVLDFVTSILRTFGFVITSYSIHYTKLYERSSKPATTSSPSSTRGCIRSLEREGATRVASARVAEEATHAHPGSPRRGGR